MGRLEEALDHLEEAARKSPSYTLKRAAIDSDFAPVCRLPRFQELLQKYDQNPSKVPS
jgi:hypothetical protein